MPKTILQKPNKLPWWKSCSFQRKNLSPSSFCCVGVYRLYVHSVWNWTKRSLQMVKIVQKKLGKRTKSNFLDHFQSSTVNNKKYYLEVMKHSYDFPTLCCKIINWFFFSIRLLLLWYMVDNIFLANDLVVKQTIKIPLSTVWNQKIIKCW